MAWVRLHACECAGRGPTGGDGKLAIMPPAWATCIRDGHRPRTKCVQGDTVEMGGRSRVHRDTVAGAWLVGPRGHRTGPNGK